MSATGTSTPQPATRLASPALSTGSSTVSASKSNHVKPKPANVFSNDGSFLERFQHLKKDEEEKKKQEETLKRKREFESRFKRRGKRDAPVTSNSDDTTENPTKKAKVDKPLTQYEKEVKSYTASLKDNGIGVRPLVK